MLASLCRCRAARSIQAIHAAAGTELRRKALSEHAHTSLRANKKIEWDDYRRHITDYELKRYLPTL